MAPDAGWPTILYDTGDLEPRVALERIAGIERAQHSAQGAIPVIVEAEARPAEEGPSDDNSDLEDCD